MRVVEIDKIDPDGHQIQAVQIHSHPFTINADKIVRIIIAKNNRATQDLSLRFWISIEPNGFKLPTINKNLTIFSILQDPTELFIADEVSALTDEKITIMVKKPGKYWANVQNMSGSNNTYKIFIEEG